MKKKLLLINCYQEKPDEKIEGYHGWLKTGAAAAGLDLAVQEVNDREAFPGADEFSALVVSGSQRMVGANEVEPGLCEFLKSMHRPLLGICYGHQVLARAFGCLVSKDGQKHLGEEEVFIKKAAGLFFGFPPVCKMRESHEEIVVRDPALEANFLVLAQNAAGRVEAIAHRENPLYGVQFHPEKSGDSGIKLLVNFLKMVSDKK